MSKYKNVIVHKSPVSGRYFTPGCSGQLIVGVSGQMYIRMKGVNFFYSENDERWVIEKVKNGKRKV